MSTLIQKCKNLVFDRLWLCSEARNCDSCPVKVECQRLFDGFDNRQYLSPASIEEFLEQFQNLLAGMKVKCQYHRHPSHPF